jgi:hypothetical protein
LQIRRLTAEKTIHLPGGLERSTNFGVTKRALPGHAAAIGVGRAMMRTVTLREFGHANRRAIEQTGINARVTLLIRHAGKPGRVLDDGARMTASTGKHESK